MKYREFDWNKDGVAVVYGGSPDERERFVREFREQHPEFKAEIMESLEKYKKRIFRKDCSVYELFLKEIPKDKKDLIYSLLNNQIKKCAWGSELFKSPLELSTVQKLRASIFCSAIAVERKFIIWDDENPFECSQAAEIICWLRSYAKGLRVVWVTGCREEEMKDCLFPWEQKKMRNVNVFNQGDEFYCLQDKKILKKSKEVLSKELDANTANVKAYKDAEAEKLMAQAAELTTQKEYQSALDIYEKLAKEGRGEAMIKASALYWEMKGTADKKWQKSRAEKLTKDAARECRLSEAYIQWGDREIAELEKTPDDDKHKKVDHLHNATVYYHEAAYLKNPKGCFLAAKLHLQYTFSREKQDKWGKSSFSYNHEDAIPYIKQLFTMNENGIEGIKGYLLELQLWNNEIYQKALTSYHNKK